MATLSFQHIEKVYDNHVQAVFDFNLEVKDKEFIVFVGPSGCGKSTTLRMIAGLEEITAGELYIDGKKVNDLEPKDRDIAMVFQSYALYPHMTVYENMGFALKLSGVPKQEIEKRVNAAAEILGLKSFLKRKPKALSGGQRQRVALGRAIVRSPKVFLMDEPLSNLDAKLRVQMRNEISKIHQKVGATTIYVTHDQTEAMTMADRIVVMKDGWIQQIGTPKEVYNEPQNLFVAGFIGSPAMNTIDCRFDGEKALYKNHDEEVVFKLPKDKIEALKKHATSSIGQMDAELDETKEAISQVNAEIEKLSKKPGSKKLIKAYQAQLEVLNNEIEKLNRMKQAYIEGKYPIVIGTRPEDVSLAAEADFEAVSEPLNIEAEITELLGHELIIYSTVADNTFTLKTKASEEIHQGDKVQCVINLDKIHLFDKESTKRIQN